MDVGDTLGGTIGGRFFYLGCNVGRRIYNNRLFSIFIHLKDLRADLHA
jgi:hypothetical protein